MLFCLLDESFLSYQELLQSDYSSFQSVGFDWTAIVGLLLKMGSLQSPFAEKLHVSKLSQAGGEERKPWHGFGCFLAVI